MQNIPWSYLKGLIEVPIYNFKFEKHVFISILIPDLQPDDPGTRAGRLVDLGSTLRLGPDHVRWMLVGLLDVDENNHAGYSTIESQNYDCQYGMNNTVSTVYHHIDILPIQNTWS